MSLIKVFLQYFIKRIKISVYWYILISRVKIIHLSDNFYLYNDNLIFRRLFRLLYDRQSNSWDNKELNMCGPEMCTPPLINSYEPHILSFGEDEGGM